MLVTYIKYIVLSIHLTVIVNKEPRRVPMENYNIALAQFIKEHDSSKEVFDTFISMYEQQKADSSKEYILHYVNRAYKPRKSKLEIDLNCMIEYLYEDIKLMRPKDGFSSPRDIELVKEVNKKSAVLERLQEAMQVMIPTFDIKEN